MTEPVDGPLINGRGTPEAVWQAWAGLAALPVIDAQTLVPVGSRAVILAPHPDDEMLGTGGLIRLLRCAPEPGLPDHRREVAVLALTDGTASHPGSATWPAARLAQTRPAETSAALRRLGAGDVTVQRLGLPDGGLALQQARLTDAIAGALRPTDTVFATWQLDGHPDHEATGRAAAQACRRTGATLVEVPIWTWHWAAPGDARVPWQRARRLPLDDATTAAKRLATDAYVSQLTPDASTGSAAILPPHVLARVLRPFEVFFL